MANRILSMRRIIQNACWPYSGKQYSVWENGRAVLQTNDLQEAEDKAGEV